MQTQKRVTFELAQSLKDIGWDALTEGYFSLEEKLFFNHGDLNNFNRTSWAISAPTLYHVCEWLVEEKQIKVSKDYDEYNSR